jgi:hypothetical protein
MGMLSVPSFGGGVALLGSSDVQRTDELQAADSYDLGERGQLIAASDLSAYLNATDAGTALTTLYGMGLLTIPQAPVLVFVGGHGGSLFVVTYNVVSGFTAAPAAGTDPTSGICVTTAVFPYVDTTNFKQRRVLLVAIGARAFNAPSTASGLYVISYDSATGFYTMLPISNYDALGTGANGEWLGGTQAVQLKPRGVIAYNNFAWAWGYDAHDHTAPANLDGPNRLMFSNVGNPLKWGNDPQDPGPYTSDHSFNDTDAFTIGGSGEVIRAACVWAGKLWIGTNDGLHYVEGFGRESFLTNGAVPVRQSKNVIGPQTLIEGPDGLLYGVSDDVGLWAFDGANSDPVGVKLRNFDGKSPGYWDLIWTDTSRTLAAYPGQSNQDLVWMVADGQTKQVWVGIPFCNASAGYGYGTDTVVIKYHTNSGGFTRQVFTGKTLSAAAFMKREATIAARRFICAPGMATNVQVYGAKATLATSPVMPSALPDVTMGEYAPHGPDGVGVSRKVYLTLSWESAAALPLAFTVTPSVDGEAVASSIKLTIGPSAPGAPTDGDVWVDTSGTDTNLGNGTAGAFTPSHAADYLVKEWKASWAKWRYTSDGGEQGTRVTVGIGFVPARGTRIKHRVTCTTGTGRYQIEGIGLEPATIRSDR